jgi:hypothetical protein
MIRKIKVTKTNGGFAQPLSIIQHKKACTEILISADQWANKGVWLKIAWKIHTLLHSDKTAGLRLRHGVGITAKTKRKLCFVDWCRVARLTLSFVSEELNDSNFRAVPELVTVFLAPLLDYIEDGEAASFSSSSVDCKRRNTGTYTSSVVVNSIRGYIQSLQDGTVKHAWFQASAAVYLRSWLFWDVTRREENR